MKRLTPQARLLSIRLARRRERRRTKRLRSRVVQVGYYFGHVRRGVLRAPRRINVTYGADREVVAFVRAISRTVLTEKKPIVLDFRMTESFFPAGTLLLFAEIDRVISLSTIPKPITCRPPWHIRPREVLKQIGIFQLTGDSIDVVPVRKDVVFWKATKGKDQSGEQFGPFLADAVDQVAADELQVGKLWPGISEAINNTIEHAYQGDRGDGFQHCSTARWWMFTQLRDRMFTAAICDLGVGYRRSTPKTLPAEFLDGLRAALSFEQIDCFAIKAAMEYGVSATGQKNRGKGSRDALSLLKEHGRGNLLILSNRGLVQYDLAPGQQEPLVRSTILSAETLSTIVWWRLPLA